MLYKEIWSILHLDFYTIPTMRGTSLLTHKHLYCFSCVQVQTQHYNITLPHLWHSIIDDQARGIGFGWVDLNT